MQIENYFIDYRYVPGSLGDHSSADNGAVIRIARRTRGAAENRITELRADPRVQWVKGRGRAAAKPEWSYDSALPPDVR